MILYRVQHAETGEGPFTCRGEHYVGRGAVWNDGPLPREDITDLDTMNGLICGVARAHHLEAWFPGPDQLAAVGFVITVWAAPAAACMSGRWQVVFPKDEAVHIRTVPLPEQWDNAIFDILEYGE